MTTTLRIDDELYRKAKVAAASQGITLTRFIEEGLQLRLMSDPDIGAKQSIVLPTFNSGKPYSFTPEELKEQLFQLDNELDSKAIC
ncbi:MAG: toxin-antitoxin system HicB family antitoxin [Deinococcales bacterium]